MAISKHPLLKRTMAVLFALVLVLSLTACGDRNPSSSSEGDDPTTVDPLTPPVIEWDDGVEPDQDTIDKIVAAYNKNSDVVGWLTFPGTTIDDMVVQGKDNVYYERLDALTKTYDWYGCYYADAGNKFGTRQDLTANTIIYGHNMSDRPADGKFSPLLGLADFNGDGVVNKADETVANPDLTFAINNPVINFTTVEDEMVFVIYAAYFTDISFQYHLETPTTAQFQNIIDEAKARSELIYDVDVTTGDKILTLSTCCYKYGGEANKDQRFVVQARLLRAGEEIPTTAKVVKNPAPKAPTFTNGF